MENKSALPEAEKQKKAKNIPYKCRLYISAIILGLNDALIEMTGALAGFTMVLPDNRTIVLAGLTTGVAATLSMSASEYLAQEAEKNALKPLIAAAITGTAYLITVAILLTPFVIIKNPFWALSLCIAFAVLLIFLFTFCESFIRQQSFCQLCLRMLCISFGVALLSFFLSWAANYYWGVHL